MFHATFGAPDLTTFCNLDALGRTVSGQRLNAYLAMLECRVTDVGDDCHGCGGRGRSLGTQSRRPAHAPFGSRPTTLLVRVRRYRCDSCRRYWADDLRKAAEARANLSRGGLGWALRALVVDHLSMSRIAAGLGVAWHTANDAALTEGHRRLTNTQSCFDGVRVIGVDEHVWSHTRHGDKYVTVIIDLTPVRDGAGPARLLDVVPGRSKAVFKQWLASRPRAWSDAIDVVAMDGFTGFKAATSEELPTATVVMDHSHVARLAGMRWTGAVAVFSNNSVVIAADPVTRSPRVVAPSTPGSGSLPTDYGPASTLCSTPTTTLTFEVTWAAYQRLIGAHRDPDRTNGKQALGALIDSFRTSVPAGLVELRRLGRTLNNRANERHPRLLRQARHEQWTHRSHQRPDRTPPRHSPRLS